MEDQEILRKGLEQKASCTESRKGQRGKVDMGEERKGELTERNFG